MTASTAIGAATARSSASATIGAGSAPAVLTYPQVLGTAELGHTLSATSGEWTGSPSSYSYQWKRCDSDGLNCVNIGTGATTYQLIEADVGSRIRVEVTATNAYGSTTQLSNATDIVTVVWADTNWLNRIELRVRHEQVYGSTHTDFPLLVRITSTELRDWAQPDGSDLVFTSVDGVTVLDHEIEQYDPATGSLVAWVRVPSLPADSDTILYLYYRHSSTTGTENPSGVWTNGFEGVWHLDLEPNGSATEDVLDSTVNGINGFAHASMDATDHIDGPIGKAFDFDGVDDLVDLGSIGSNGWSAVTASTWLRKADSGDDRLICRTDTTSGSSTPLCLRSPSNRPGLRIETRGQLVQDNHFGVVE